MALGGIGGFFGIKYLIEHYADKETLPPDVDNHDDGKRQLDSYLKFRESSPERAQLYEQFGESVDGLYYGFFAKELESGWQDDADMQQLSLQYGDGKSLKGVVPYCMDGSFSSVDSMLSETSIRYDFFQQDLQEIKLQVAGWFSGSSLGKMLATFLNSLPSFAGIAPGKAIQERFSLWLSPEHAPERIGVLKAFFRQQMRVTTFLKYKEQELIKQIAVKKFKSDPRKFKELDDALEDEQWFEANISQDPDFKVFRKGNLSNASQLLTRYGIMGAEVPKEAQDIIESCDEARSEILDEDEQ